MVAAKPNPHRAKTLMALARCVGVSWPGDSDTLQQALLGATSLDLSGLPITDLSPLAGLTHLRSLNLSNTAVTALAPLADLAGLRELRLRETKVTDLSPLEGLAHLEVLDLGQTRVKDVALLAKMPRLRVLKLDKTLVADIDPLASIQALEELDLSTLKFVDLAPLSSLPALRHLSLYYCRKIKDFSALGSMTSLVDLNLGGTEIKKLEVLKTLCGLARLNVSVTGIRDLSPLASLPALERLSIIRVPKLSWATLTGLSKLTALETNAEPVHHALIAKMTQLRTLVLHGSTPGTDLAVFRHLAGLEDLELWAGTGWSNIHALGALTRLRRLMLYPFGAYDDSRKPMDLTWLRSLTALEVLNIGGLGATDLTPLASLARLRSLDISQNPITSLTPLQALPLTRLKMYGAVLDDWTPLASLTGLVELSLFDCNLADLSLLLEMRRLQHLVLRDAPITDFSPLGALTTLETLNLSGVLRVDLTSLRELSKLTRLDISRYQMHRFLKPQEWWGSSLRPLVTHAGLRHVDGLPVGMPEIRELEARGIHVTTWNPG